MPLHIGPPEERSLRILAERVDYRCCGKNCFAATTVQDGVAVQIGSADSASPRYDRWLSPQKAEWLQNYVWLCSTCAARVERDPLTYTSDVLQDWKDVAETIAETEHLAVIERAKALTEAATPRARQLRIFMCHASEDKPRVRAIAGQLASLGYAPWVDEQDLMPGDEWRKQIETVIRLCDVFVVWLSHVGASKCGYVQEEIRLATEVADARSQRRLIIVPVKLDQCDIPVNLERWHCVDLTDDGGLDRFLQVLRARAQHLL